MAKAILVVAVNKAGEKSAPVKVFQTSEDKLPKKFVLKLTEAPVNENGVEQTRMGNFALNLIATNSTDFLEEKLKGFRQKLDGEVFIVCEQFSENIASLKDIAKDAEEF